MLIKQTRIMNLSKLQFVKEGTIVRIGVGDLQRFNSKLKEIGFEIPLEPGFKVLPKVVGPVSDRNANGYYEIHKDREKETHYSMIEWTYQQWAGRGKQ